MAIEDQFYLGSTGLLARPVVAEGSTTADVYLLDDQPYYDYYDFEKYVGKCMHTIPAPIDKLPLLMCGGHIFPRRDRARWSTAWMRYDPVTLVVVLGSDHDDLREVAATGEIYLDDGETFEYERGAQMHCRFHFDGNTSTITSEDVGLHGELTADFVESMKRVKVERIVIVGVPATWEAKESVLLREGDSRLQRKVELQMYAGAEGQENWAIVSNPAVEVGTWWEITF